MTVRVLAVGMVAALVLSGCGGTERSAQAVCHVFDTQAVALHDAYQQDAAQVSKGNPLPTFIDVIKLPNDMAVLMHQMDKVAPDPIESDFASLASYFEDLSKNQGKELSDPVGALGQGLVSAIGISGSYARVDSFLAANCHLPGSGT